VDEPDSACMHLPAKSRGLILTCDNNIETAQAFGGPLWHVSGWSPSRVRAAAVLSSAGEEVLFHEASTLRNEVSRCLYLAGPFALRAG
jgi:hypothetical protein